MVFKLSVLLLSLFAGSQAAQFIIKNNEVGTVWIGILGNDGRQPLNNGGFVLGAGEETTIFSPEDWAGRFWARTWCDEATQHCETGDCGNRLECAGNGGAPPVSLAEITLKGWGGLDYYDLSLVDGFNIPVTMRPLDGESDGDYYSCGFAKCLHHINDECPEELKLFGSTGVVIGCKSACLAFDTDEYCCRGDHNQPETCQSTDWPFNYPAFFKERCPDAYSYAYDDVRSTFTCVATGYEIVFGG